MSLRFRLARDERGATIVEFALVAPVLLLLLMGAFDVSHTLYMRTTIQGIVQKTGRDSALEAGSATAQQTALDAKVTAQVKALANNATVTFARRYFRTFSQAAAVRAETWTDTNRNGTCDGSEPYEDANRNSAWDFDGADAGQGGAKDKTIYVVAVSYPRMFPVYNWIGGSKTTTITAATVLANQPYGDQATYGATVVRNCPAAVVRPTPTATPSGTPTPGNSATPTCALVVLGICAR